MRKQILKSPTSTMPLKGTPFVAFCKNGIYVLGRTDTKQTLAIGAFNKTWADMHTGNEKVYLRIQPNGEATEHYPPAGAAPVDVVTILEDNSAIVMIMFDNYWLTPSGFDNWLTTSFKNTYQNG